MIQNILVGFFLLTAALTAYSAVRSYCRTNSDVKDKKYEDMTEEDKDTAAKLLVLSFISWAICGASLFIAYLISK
jgi:hypothetical protein